MKINYSAVQSFKRQLIIEFINCLFGIQKVEA